MEGRDHQLRNTWCPQKLEEARNGFSPRDSGGTQPCGLLDFGLLAPRSAKEAISVALTTRLVAIGPRSHRKLVYKMTEDVSSFCLAGPPLLALSKQLPQPPAQPSSMPVLSCLRDSLTSPTLLPSFHPAGLHPNAHFPFPLSPLPLLPQPLCQIELPFF